MIQYVGLFVLAAIALNMYALIGALLSEAKLTTKAVWSVVLLALPLVGFVAWYLLGPRQGRS